MSKLILLVGPCGSGKSTLAKEYVSQGYTYVNQDSQDKFHLHIFKSALENGMDVIVDRMGFSKEQRDRYLSPAHLKGYETEIIVLHESFKTCLDRCIARKNHENIHDEATARKVLDLFFSKYERVEDNEANVVDRRWPQGSKDKAILCDLDGTLCNINHRLHYVNNLPEGQKKDWNSFFKALPGDEVNYWCWDILDRFQETMPIVYCSGRSDSYKRATTQWLKDNDCWYGKLYMRGRNDYREDSIVKEIILDFEILTRYEPYFVIDDRSRVVSMWRKRGIVCLQCANGLF